MHRYIIYEITIINIKTTLQCEPMAIHRRQFLSYLTTLAALSALPRCARAAITSRIAAQFGVLPTPEKYSSRY